MAGSPSSARPPVVAVIGAEECDESLAGRAEEVGALLARAGAVVVTGGRGGVSAAACRGARRAGGIAIGLLPGDRPDEANPDVTVALPTGLGHARNFLVVRAAAAVIAIGGRYGTLSELAMALTLGLPVVALDSWEIPGVEPVESPAAAAARALAHAGRRP